MKKLQLKGSARERGYLHGELMREEINTALDYYRAQFSGDRARLQNHVNLLMQPLMAFRPEYRVEMDAIAEASGVEPFWIYCINGRSELMSSPVPTECSVIAFPQQGLLGQNWDWARALQGQLALADIELESGHRLLTMTEPGMLAKIGMNSAGLGVCLNILPANQKLTGLPVHFLLRALLECQSLQEARDLINQYGSGKASHVIVADQHTSIAVELAPDQPWFQSTEQSVYLHTNHYLQAGQAQPTSSRPCTETRLEKLRGAIQQTSGLNLNTMQRLLNENEQPYPILRPYSYHELTGYGGTLVTLLMDLGKRQMLLREGFDPGVGFDSYAFD
ncbi:C45 family peptidase [Endozoicomonas sp. SCSIO W0465]|uniref:C45 family autoproteolytic acyltransferase/hydolase n=1 Tax=Endozoicomonas sp. SCSIO W0465 TaxID=2918516 RepID=UPI0020766724|nr:C45 family peptidase [Endozoicomonas sp. SCSIO W0465]USE37279.1 C45 family peptidase [Endozoicomonas sp. SCSIO W0465]